LAATAFDWEKLLPLLKYQGIWNSEFRIPNSKFPVGKNSPTKVRIAWACDRSFNFYYQDNLDVLTQLGAQIIPWSPLKDTNLPEDTQGIYLGGGFPEVFAEELANNYQGLKAVKKAVLQGIPTLAECGGLMYLCEEILDFNQVSWPMVGILPSKAVMTSRLTLGYRKAIALQDSPLLKTGQVIYGHEFHRSQLTMEPPKPLFQTRNYSQPQQEYHEGWQVKQVHGSYLHLHFGEQQNYLQRFLDSCVLHS
jgi:cobyrinic acid a,c-diamide synthase